MQAWRIVTSRISRAVGGYSKKN